MVFLGGLPLTTMESFSVDAVSSNEDAKNGGEKAEDRRFHVVDVN